MEKQASYEAKRVYVQIEYFSWGFMQAHEGLKIVMEEKKWRACKNNFVERKDFITCYQEDSWMDLSELQAIYSLHIEL